MVTRTDLRWLDQNDAGWFGECVCGGLVVEKTWGAVIRDLETNHQGHLSGLVPFYKSTIQVPALAVLIAIWAILILLITTLVALGL